MKTIKPALTYLTILLFVIAAFTNIYGQNNSQAQVDSMAKKIEEIDKRLNENNYEMVPRKDLEDKLTNMISKEVDETITSWLIFISIILGAFGGIAIYATRQFIKEKMNTDFTVLIDNTFEKNLSVFKKELELIKSYNLDSRKSFYETELDRIKKEVDANVRKQIRSEEPYRKLVSLIEGLEEIEYFELIPDAIDEMAGVCYDLRMYDELDKYVAKYSEYELKARTYMSAALVQYNKIVISGDAGIRSKLMKYLDKSLNKLHDYGEAKGLKLIVYMIDYDRAASDEEKQQAKEITLTLIKEINRSIVTPLETIGRLNSDKTKDNFQKYITLLYQLFPDEMQEMEDNAMKAQQLSAATKSNDSSKVQDLIKELYPPKPEGSDGNPAG